MPKTKLEIMNYCKRHAESSFNLVQMSTTAAEVSDSLNISRSLASQYLNSLYKEGTLIKILTRPTQFLFKKSAEEYLQVKIQQADYYDFNDIFERNKNNREGHSFQKLLENSQNLSHIVEQIISAIRYPLGGLPILIVGNPGVGKSFLCKEAFRYGKENKFFGDNAGFVKLHVQKKDKDYWPELVSLFEKSCGGILVISHADRLSSEGQRKLCEVLESKKYIKGNEVENLNSEIILTVGKDYQKFLDHDLIRSLPVICNIPDFNERTRYEREDVVVDLFKTKAAGMNKKVLISRDVIDMLAGGSYPGNIDELNNIVVQMYATANSHSSSTSVLTITAADIPNNSLMLLTAAENSSTNDDMVDILSYHPIETEDLFLRSLEEIYNINVKKGCDDEAKDRTIKNIQSFLSEQNYISDERIKTILNYSFTNAAKSVHYTVPISCIDYLTCYLYYLYTCSPKLINWEASHRSESDAYYSKYSQKFVSIHLIVERMSSDLAKTFNIRIGSFLKILLSKTISYYNESSKKTQYLCVIAAHGNSTASSIAAAVNELLNAHIFNAFDMPLDTTVESIANELSSFINQYEVTNDVILLVDMGSLEKLGDYLKVLPNKRIGIMNNVSTKMALSVGEQAIKGNNIQSIFEDVKRESACEYAIVESENRNNIVIFVSETSISMAEKMRDMFIHSLPNNAEIDVVAMDLKNYLDSDYMGLFRKSNNILFVSGSCGEPMNEEEFIPIEDLISDQNISLIDNLLVKSSHIEDVNEFNNNLLYNFSLENIIDNITILDAKKLLHFAEIVVNNFQIYMGIKLTSTTLVGLYMHICCMIERLVIKQPIKSRENIEQFETENKQLILEMTRCLEPVSKHYGVTIPTSEIAYLFDYIQHDAKAKSL